MNKGYRSLCNVFRLKLVTTFGQLILQRSKVFVCREIRIDGLACDFNIEHPHNKSHHGIVPQRGCIFFGFPAFETLYAVNLILPAQKSLAVETLALYSEIHLLPLIGNGLEKTNVCSAMIAFAYLGVHLEKLHGRSVLFLIAVVLQIFRNRITNFVFVVFKNYSA